MTEHETEQLLTSGLDQLGINTTSGQLKQLVQYLELFEKWNRAYNLSAIRDRAEMVRLHLLDSLAVRPHLHGERLIDVGTGGGLPGIPLAITMPHMQFTLLDSAGKKMRFLFQVKQELGLRNVEIENCRVEKHQPAVLYDGVISRAFASLLDMTTHCRHLVSDQGRLWAMKGVFPEQELAAIADNYTVEQCHHLKIPGVDAQRCLLVLKPRQ